MPDSTTKNEEIHDFLSSSVNVDGDITDVSRQFGRATIMWRFVSSAGDHFYLKCHEARPHFEAEVRSLEVWVPAIQPAAWWRAPETVAVSRSLGALIMTGLPGQAA